MARPLRAPAGHRGQGVVLAERDLVLEGELRWLLVVVGVLFVPDDGRGLAVRPHDHHALLRIGNDQRVQAAHDDDGDDDDAGDTWWS